MRERDAEWNYLVHESIGPFPGLERPQWLTPVKPFWRGNPPTATTKREKQESWGHMGTMLAITQAEECLASRRPFWCWQPFQGERWGSEAHTKTCQCTICNKNFQKARSLDVIEWSTAKNNLVPQGQWNRPYWSKCTVKIKFVPQGQSDRPRQYEAHCKK